MLNLRAFLRFGASMGALALGVVVTVNPPVAAQDKAKQLEELAAGMNIPGGLCVQVGAADVTMAAELARTGRFLVHVLEADPGVVEQTRRRLQSEGLYGSISVERWEEPARLPYSENLINLLLVTVPVAPKEISRVLCPRGAVCAASGTASAADLNVSGLTEVQHDSPDGSWLTARKPWPESMDEWTHARHSAAGNPVSHDTAVGPPRRVRWVTGLPAQYPVPDMVSARGRNFYGTALARDGFNGLRLWGRDMARPDATEPYLLRPRPRDVPPPVAGGDFLFAVSGNVLLAVDSATGETVREYPAAGTPSFFVHDEGVLIVVSGETVRALEVETGKLLWEYASAEPRHLVAGGDVVGLVQGRARRGEKGELVALDIATGELRWKRGDLPWTNQVTRSIYSAGLLAYEISTLSDDGPGNSLHVVSAADGRLQWESNVLPGMNHARQARAMFANDRLWLLHGGRIGEAGTREREPIRCSAFDMATGEVLVTHEAATMTNCFPPVATVRYMLSGRLDLTNLETGEMDANRITKGACGREYGWVPANGLINVMPKHCVCWPMLRGYAALASEAPGGDDPSRRELRVEDIVVQRFAEPPAEVAAEDGPEAWPSYRRNAWRSGSTPAAGPAKLDVSWIVELGDIPADRPIAVDWREDPFSKGAITSPVVAGGLVYVARPHAHEVVALDAGSGKVRWRFTASGRVDTAPTVHGGLCLFGAKSGWVYALRADDGRVVWRLRAGPREERIVAYGQVESPWPVPGSVLVVDGTAYFAAGRQAFADGGIRVFAVEPRSGEVRWVRKLDTIPQVEEGRDFYGSSALEFDNFDLLHREGDGVAMSRWVFGRADGEMSIDSWSAFARLNTGGGSAMVPRSFWSYAPRNQRRIPSHTAYRPLVAFRDNLLLGCLQDRRTVFRRDFALDDGEEFDTRWMTGWAASELSREGKMPWPNHRLAEKATWQIDVFNTQDDNQTIDAMALAGDRLYLAGSGGALRIMSIADGSYVAKTELPAAPMWDGMAIAAGRLFVATADGRLLCLGE
ncbi:MAG: PQQ-binding-like beta-propeller repeat protein [Thermoguttaceae bacterium]|nr:PQQ-binding-like beta-propeller repeat protein [Thermoguttaceae bacterium]